MDADPKQSNEQELLKAWQEYGKRFSTFVPEEQPFPSIWDPAIPQPDEKGRIHRDALKHWEQLFPTKEFLRLRYAQYHILESPSLDFDCLVPKFQRRMYYRMGEDEHGFPVHNPVNDGYEWYASALRIGIFQWQVSFSCRSVLCERNWCKLHRDNPGRINPIDIYSLMDLFEGCGLGQALSRVEKWFGVKIQPFDSAGEAPVKGYRYSVPKQALYDLLANYVNMRSQHVSSFLKEAVEVIKGSQLVPWHGRQFNDEHAFLSQKVVGNLHVIKSPAAKAYLWLLIRQEEAARNTREVFSVTDTQLAQGLGVSKTTAAKYRERLQELGLVKTVVDKIGKISEIRVKSVKY